MDKAKRKKMSLEVIPAIIIDFRGLERGEMMTRDDDDIVNDFVDFCRKNKIWTVACGGLVGGGRYLYAHMPKDQKKIVEWFKAQGIKPKEYPLDWDYEVVEEE